MRWRTPAGMMTGTDLAIREVADFNASAAFRDDVPLDGAFHLMPRCRDAWLDACARDRNGLVRRAVVGFDDVAALGCGELFRGILFPESG